jgi:hypothetical protein
MNGEHFMTGKAYLGLRAVNELAVNEKNCSSPDLIRYFLRHVQREEALVADGVNALIQAKMADISADHNAQLAVPD